MLTRTATALTAFLFLFVFSLNAQTAVKTISLEQTPGEFTVQNISVAPGDYQFEIANNGVAHEVGFVLVPKGKTEAEDHIKEAYVQAPVAEGKRSMTKVVSLEEGEYEYFCPLNPTAKYPLTVVNTAAKKISLEQTEGQFTIQSLTLTPGDYQFEIANNGVEHEVGFVLVPQGKTGADNHIKEAYVQKAVANGSSSLTKVVHLEKGTYEYFCPLNPTPKYLLEVK